MNMQPNDKHVVTFVLFGATGDLAQKKILPALKNLFDRGAISLQSSIMAFTRRDWNDDDYRAFARQYIETEHNSNSVEAGYSSNIEGFLSKLIHIKGTFDDSEAYKTLHQKIQDIYSQSASDSENQNRETIFHIAIQPEFYEQVFENLGKAGFGNQNDSTFLNKPKIIVEKPFGSDFESAEALQKTIEHYFDESQMYRIDHYLGKGGLRAIIEERQNNSEFETSLSNKSVASIHFKIFETLDIQGRGEFYEQNGALRDVGQNHLLEMLAVTMGEIHDAVQGNSIVDRTQILQQLPDVDADFVKEHVQRAQYEEYRTEEGVSATSKVETYFKITTQITAPRWNGVDLVLEGGKALSKKEVSVTITYKDGSQKVFDIQKKMTHNEPDAYEILIQECAQGNKQWFVSMDEVRALWKFVSPILKSFDRLPLLFYKKGTDPHVK